MNKCIIFLLYSLIGLCIACTGTAPARKLTTNERDKKYIADHQCKFVQSTGRVSDWVVGGSEVGLVGYDYYKCPNGKTVALDAERETK